MKPIKYILAIIVCITTIGCNEQAPTVTLSKTENHWFKIKNQFSAPEKPAI